MKKRTTNGQTINRGMMRQITRQKEACDKYYGGENLRRLAVGHSCIDCLLANCRKNCGGINR